MNHINRRQHLILGLVTLLFGVTLWTVLVMLGIVVSFVNEDNVSGSTFTVWLSRLPLTLIGLGLLILILRIQRGRITRSLGLLVIVNALVFGLFFFHSMAVQIVGSLAYSVDSSIHLYGSWQTVGKAVLIGFPAALYLLWLWAYANIEKLVALSYSLMVIKRTSQA